MKLKNILVFISVLFVFTQCTKEASVKLPESDPKPVLVCFISPDDSLIKVNLTNSIPLYTGNTKTYPKIINNATISISNGNSSAVIPWINDSLGYRLSTKQFAIVSGTTYQLDITIPDGRKLSATTKVPSTSFPSLNSKRNKIQLDSNEFNVSYQVDYEFNWQDNPGEGNYYRIVYYTLIYDSNLYRDTVAEAMVDQFENDQGKDGSKMMFKASSFEIYQTGNPMPLSVSQPIYFIICNKDYFDYHRDLSINNDDNPFSEAKINYTNIVGGIGCFGAYGLVKKRI